MVEKSLPSKSNLMRWHGLKMSWTEKKIVGSPIRCAEKKGKNLGGKPTEKLWVERQRGDQ